MKTVAEQGNKIHVSKTFVQTQEIMLPLYYPEL